MSTSNGSRKPGECQRDWAHRQQLQAKMIAGRGHVSTACCPKRLTQTPRSHSRNKPRSDW